ncbi:hypothetical protein [Novosphingobium sp. FKTRR1]|uniref:hypothetical protein n=1 Tax=unclassified Novosphingobium TaxID=2644732 RepID=UPI001CF0BF3B|nr:hypothetical protein [Novosphingobium sp. FKTRR1]
MEKSHHILNAAGNLLGISLLIIAGLHLTKNSGQTLADEVAWVAALSFCASSIFSYLSIRNDGAEQCERTADKVFLVGLGALLIAVAILAASNIA